MALDQALDPDPDDDAQVRAGAPDASMDLETRTYTSPPIQ